MPTIVELAQALRRGDLSIVELVDASLQRISATDGKLRAWETVVGEGALAEARRLESLLRQGTDLGPLHGIPFGVKDNICTEGIRTTGSSCLYADFVPDHDATVVARLKRAGAIVLGKTTTAEMALGDAPPTRNPWNVAHTPGGSSSGSAAAVAAGHVPFALATQTGGSLNRPAAYCGLVALKPTYGHVCMDGVLPVSPTLDHVGAMTRTAEDQAIVVSQLMRGEGTVRSSGSRHVSKSGDRAGTDPGLQGLKVGRPDRYFFDELHPAQRQAYDEALLALEREFGLIVHDVVLPASFDEAIATHTIIMECEAADMYGQSLRQRGHLIRPLLRNRLQRGKATSRSAYVEALGGRDVYIGEMRALLDGTVDLLATPATPGPAPYGIQSTGPSGFNSPFSLTGFPTIVFPTGIELGSRLPLSVQFVAAPWQEALLLDVAMAYQRVSDWHSRRPSLPATESP